MSLLLQKKHSIGLKVKNYSVFIMWATNLPGSGSV
jgi:hypothetical protein